MIKEHVGTRRRFHDIVADFKTGGMSRDWKQLESRSDKKAVQGSGCDENGMQQGEKTSGQTHGSVF